MNCLFKKIVLAFIMLFSVITVVSCDDTQSIELDTLHVDLKINQTYEISAKVYSVKDYTLVYEALDEDVVKVEENVVTALKEGTTIVKVSVLNTNLYKELTINVTDNITCSIKIIDIDGYVLSDKTIQTKKSLSLFEILKTNFNVLYTVGDYGAYITSVENSIVDPYYFLSFSVNGKELETGVESTYLNDNDKVEITNTCFNTVEYYGTFDETDLLVDKIIYSYMRNSFKNTFEKADKFYDYYITSSVMQMIKNGYDTNVFNFNHQNANALKQTLENYDFENEKVANNYMKAYITMKALDANTTNLEKALKNLDKINDYQLICAYNLDITSDAIKQKIDSITEPSTSGDMALMTAPVFSLYKEYGLEAYNRTKEDATSDGIDCYGVNSASSGIYLISGVTNGINPRSEEFDMVEAICKYYDGEGFKWKLTDEKADLAFSTPQCIASLMMYKIFRDKGVKINIFDFK